MNDSHTFTVPLIPPSVNHYKRPRLMGDLTRGFYVTKEAQAFIDAVCMLSGRQLVPGRYYQVSIQFHIPAAEFHRCDVDNFSKVSCDALTTAGLISDDRYISDLHLVKRPVTEPQDARTVYQILGREQL